MKLEIFIRDFIVNVIIVSVLTVYTVGLLWIADNFLLNNLPGYIYSGNYSIGIVMFFFAGMAYIHLAQWKQWTDWRYYILGSIAIFFPLVFISSALKLFINPSNELIISYSTQYCDTAITFDICGKAFAAVVSSMSLRALPTVLSVPAIVYLFLFNRKRRASEL